MADQLLIDELRRLTNVEVAEYSNMILSQMIDAAGVNASAASIWRGKAAKYAELVDVSEAGASRSMSQLYKQAKEQSEYFQFLADREIEAAAGIKSRTRVNRIERV